MNTWPVSLQQLLNTDSFEMKLGTTSIRTDMDVGPAKVRARYTDAVDPYTTSINLDFDQYNDFIQFYKVSLNNGVDTFQFPDPFTAVDSTWRFVEAPSIRPLGGRVFTLSMSWEKLP